MLYQKIKKLHSDVSKVFIFTLTVLVLLMVTASRVRADGTYSLVNTSAGNDCGPDCLNFSQGRVWTIDNYGKFIWLIEAGNGDHTWVWSNDNGSSWSQSSEVQSWLQRGSVAYDKKNDKLHVIWNATANTDGIIYRRYGITRDGSNNITAITREDSGNINLQLDTSSSGALNQPVALWIDDGSTNGLLVAIWSKSGTGFSEIRGSMRHLSLSAADGTAGNWLALDNVGDTFGIDPPAVAADKIYSYTSGIAGVSVGIRGGSGSRKDDIYVFADENIFNGHVYAYRAIWNAANKDWRGGWQTRVTVGNVGDNTQGYGMKYELITRPVLDTANDRFYVGWARWKDNTYGDTASLAYLDGSDNPSATVDVYSANGSHSYAPTLDIAYANGLIYMSYDQSSTNGTSQAVYYNTISGTSLGGSATAFLTSGKADIPILYDSNYNGKLLFAFRRDDTTPKKAYFGYVNLPASGGSNGFPSSSSYQLNGFSFGGGSKNSIGSSNYSVQGRMGEVANNGQMSTGNGFKFGAGLAFARQANMPKAPIFVNDGGYSNKLHLTINNTSGDGVFPQNSVLDNFDRSNGTLGSNWSNVWYSSNSMEINSNQIRVNSLSSDVANYWNVTKFGPDCEVFFDTSILPSNGVLTALLRLDNAGKNTYYVEYNKSGSDIMVYHLYGSGPTWDELTNISTAGNDLSDSDSFGVRLVGQTFTFYKKHGGIWSVMSSYTDNANLVTGAGYIGIGGYIAATNDYRADNFGAGNINPASGVPAPSDTKFAIAISTDNFATTKYVRAADNTIGTTLTTSDYQTYAQWGGSSGTYVVGLGVGVTYSVKVKAMQGNFSESGYGPVATAGTSSVFLSYALNVGPTYTNSTSNYVVNLGDLIPGTVVTSNDKVWVDVATNAASGVNVHIYSKNAGLLSAVANYNIGGTTADLDLADHGFGVQGVGTSQGSGGPLTIVAPYNGNSDVVGKADTVISNIFSSSSAITGGRGWFVVKARAGNTSPSANDYSEVLTVIASANF